MIAEGDLAEDSYDNEDDLSDDLDMNLFGPNISDN